MDFLIINSHKMPYITCYKLQLIDKFAILSTFNHTLWQDQLKSQKANTKEKASKAKKPLYYPKKLQPIAIL